MFTNILLIAFSTLSVITGTVTDRQTGEPLPGATVEVKETGEATAADNSGKFTIELPDPQREYTLVIKSLGYSTVTQKIIPGNRTKNLQISLLQDVFLSEEVVVQATRADDKTGTVYSELDQKLIDEQNLGKDITYLLNLTPSTVVTSDAGNGIGYTGIRIRGSDPQRTNVTVNGIPMNDAESQGTFWVNLPDFASSTQNIQIQRGVGTSTNGAGAFGASINILTENASVTPYARVDNTYGSFNSWRHSVSFGTGLMNKKFAIDGRLSKISSDGFVDRSASDLKSFFVSGTYFGNKSMLKFNAFSGKEITQQAWWGTPEVKLKGNSQGIEDYIINNGLNEAQAQNIRNSDNRKYNYYIYDNEVDNYQQDHYQLLYSKELSSLWSLNAALHYTRGRGYFEQSRYGNEFSKLGLPNVTIGDSTLETSDFIVRRWLDNHFYGAVYSATYKTDRLTFITGGGLNQYTGYHYGEIMWAQFAPNINIGDRYYFGNSVKTDLNHYVRANYQVMDKLTVYGDMQYRYVNYEMNGKDNDLKDISQLHEFNFFNPKAGVNYDITTSSSVFASFAVANREPNRADFRASEAGNRPNHETLYDWEAGYKAKIQNVNLMVNGFYMDYRNQLVLTGDVNDVGASIRANVPRSYRAGVELTAQYKPLDVLTVGANATYSQNKINSYNEFIVNYDEYNDAGNPERIVINHKNTDIAFSPNTIVGGLIAYEPVKGLLFTLMPKYVGKQYLDNTSDNNKKIDGFFVTDLTARYVFDPRLFREAVFTVGVYNLANAMYTNNGYTYSYQYGGNVIYDNHLYPQAGRNYMASLSLRF